MPWTKKSAWFSAIATRDDALKVIRSASNGFYFLAVLTAAAAFLFGIATLADAVILAVGSYFLRRFYSRVAAIVLILLSGADAAITVANMGGANLGGGKNVYLALIVLYMAVRAALAAFKLHGRFAESRVAVEPANRAQVSGAVIDEGRSAKLKDATRGDLLLSLIVPGWGLLIGLVALFKREFRRAVTMMLMSGAAITFFIAVYPSFRAGYASARGGAASAAGTSMSIHGTLAEAAAKITAETPKMVNATTRLDSARVGPGLLFTYLYTEVNIRHSARMPPAEFEQRIGDAVRKQVCAAGKLKVLFDANVSVKFVYRAVDRSEIGEVLIKPRACRA